MSLSNLSKASVYFKKKDTYFSSIRCNANEKYNFMMSFDSEPIKSVTMYMDYLIKLFYDCSLIEMQLNNKQLEVVTKALGLYSQHRAYEFTRAVHMVIDEDNFLTITFETVKRMMKFEDICRDLGYIK